MLACIASFLSEQAHGARRTYTAADLDVLREIRDLHQAGRVGDEIKERLKNYIVVIPENDLPAPPPEIPTSSALALRKDLQNLQTLLERMLDEQKATRDEITQLRAELESRRRWWRFWDR